MKYEIGESPPGVLVGVNVVVKLGSIVKVNDGVNVKLVVCVLVGVGVGLGVSD